MNGTAQWYGPDLTCEPIGNLKIIIVTILNWLIRIIYDLKNPLIFIGWYNRYQVSHYYLYDFTSLSRVLLTSTQHPLPIFKKKVIWFLFLMPILNIFEYQFKMDVRTSWYWLYSCFALHKVPNCYRNNPWKFEVDRSILTCRN